LRPELGAGFQYSPASCKFAEFTVIAIPVFHSFAKPAFNAWVVYFHRTAQTKSYTTTIRPRRRELAAS